MPSTTSNEINYLNLFGIWGICIFSSTHSIHNSVDKSIKLKATRKMRINNYKNWKLPIWIEACWRHGVMGQQRHNIVKIHLSYPSQPQARFHKQKSNIILWRLCSTFKRALSRSHLSMLCKARARIEWYQTLPPFSSASSFPSSAPNKKAIWRKRFHPIVCKLRYNMICNVILAVYSIYTIVTREKEGKANRAEANHYDAPFNCRPSFQQYARHDCRRTIAMAVAVL